MSDTTNTRSDSYREIGSKLRLAADMADALAKLTEEFYTESDSITSTIQLRRETLVEFKNDMGVDSYQTARSTLNQLDKDIRILTRRIHSTYLRMLEARRAFNAYVADVERILKWLDGGTQ